jgi:hypothetical protein
VLLGKESPQSGQLFKTGFEAIMKLLVLVLGAAGVIALFIQGIEYSGIKQKSSKSLKDALYDEQFEHKGLFYGDDGQDPQPYQVPPPKKHTRPGGTGNGYKGSYWDQW